MRVFISWSGVRSKVMATALKTWLSDVFQDVHTWMSEHDLDAGMQWSSHLSEQLEAASFGILCLTPDNLTSPWLLFEAGALSKIVKSARVVPYRLALKATDVGYPLAQFQGVDADEDGTFKLLQSLNSSREVPLPDERLKRLFNKWWPDLQKQLQGVPSHQSETTQKRTERSLLEEILQLVRQQSQVAQPPAPSGEYWQLYVGAHDISPPHGTEPVIQAPLQERERSGDVRGMVVTHSQLGVGRIIAMEGTGPNAKATVDFDKHGRRRVIARFLMPNAD